MISKGLTGIKEQAVGLIGRKPKFDKTLDGKPRVYFELGIGIEDSENLKYCTWRHCIAYGDNSLKLENADIGTRVAVWGWVTTEAVRDEYGKPVIENEKVVKREYLIAFKYDKAVQILDYQKLQEELPLGVGQAFAES